MTIIFVVHRSTSAGSYLFSLFSASLALLTWRIRNAGTPKTANTTQLRLGSKHFVISAPASMPNGFLVQQVFRNFFFFFFPLAQLRFVCARRLGFLSFPPTSIFFPGAFLVHSVFPFGPVGASERLSRMPHRELLVNSIHGLTLMELLTVCAIRCPFPFPFHWVRASPATISTTPAARPFHSIPIAPWARVRCRDKTWMPFIDFAIAFLGALFWYPKS